MLKWPAWLQAALIGLPIILAAGGVLAAPACDGKYEAARQMLDAAYGKYGTLYSGGNHSRSWGHDNTGATLDLYRLWRGLPDQRFRDADDLSYHDAVEAHRSDDRGWPVAAFREWLPVATGTGEVSDSDRYVVATLADLATVIRSIHTPDWWLTETPRFDFSDGEEAIHALARTEPLVDWLQVTLAASHASWSVAWHLGSYADWLSRAFERLRAHAFARFQVGDGIEWAVAALITRHPRDDALDEALMRVQDAWLLGVDDCTASPGEYAALMIGRFENARAGHHAIAFEAGALPAPLQLAALRNAVMEHAWNAALHGDALSGPLKSDRSFSTLPAALAASFQSWVNVARTYFSSTVDELIAVHADTPLDPRTVRALNVLSAADLADFARGAGRSSEDRARFLTVAFLRRFALRQDRAAAAMISEILRESPEPVRQAAGTISLSWPLEVRLALLALALPDRSLWLTVEGSDSYYFDEAVWLRHQSKRGVDLPPEFRSADFLQRDLETLLLLPHRWRAYEGMLRFNVGVLERAHSRSYDAESPEFAIVANPTALPEGPDRSGLRLRHLIAWKEISRLGPREGLSRRLAEVVVRWADHGSGNRLKRLFAPKDVMADALREIVLLGKRNDLGEIDGKPAGRRAFEILKIRFPDTDAARRTKYWYYCDMSCDD